MSQVKLFVATKALIRYNNKVLILRESDKYQDGTNQGKFDLPGGRIEPGQRFDESLLREIKEETGLSVRVGKPYWVDEWRPEVKEEKWQIVGIFFECFSDSDKVTLGPDHSEALWIEPSNYNAYNLIPNLKNAFTEYLKVQN